MSSLAKLTGFVAVLAVALVASVTEEVSEIPGVSTVEVDLPSGRLSVTSHQPVDEERVRTAVVEAGYEVTHGDDS